MAPRARSAAPESGDRVGQAVELTLAAGVSCDAPLRGIVVERGEAPLRVLHGDGRVRQWRRAELASVSEASPGSTRLSREQIAFRLTLRRGCGGSSAGQSAAAEGALAGRDIRFWSEAARRWTAARVRSVDGTAASIEIPAGGAAANDAVDLSTAVWELAGEEGSDGGASAAPLAAAAASRHAGVCAFRTVRPGVVQCLLRLALKDPAARVEAQFFPGALLVTEALRPASAAAAAQQTATTRIELDAAAPCDTAGATDVELLLGGYLRATYQVHPTAAAGGA